jgi:ribosome biogenesis GTPase
MRELGLLESSESDAVFEDIAELAAECRFRDCRHAGEPGCAVVGAIERGELDHERLSSQHKLERELAFERRKVDAFARRRAHDEFKRRTRANRQRDKLGK